jgi:carbon-monoxide dehydrogenase medium subunit
MSLPRFDYRAPATVEEAVALRQEFGDDALVMAGGLATVILLRERLVSPRVVISLSDVPALQRIETNGELRIGAMATHSAVAASAAVGTVAPMLREACGRVGSPAIRNMGTLGGSVCHGDAASDPAPALLALGAEALVAGPAGQRRVPLSEFFVGTLTTALKDDELLTALCVPRPAAGARTRFVKYTATSAEAFSTVTVAVLIQFDGASVCVGARIGLGSVGPTPLRATAAEEVLRGRKLSPETIAGAAAAAMACTEPSSSGQGSAEYRCEMTGVWVRRLLEDMASR